MPSVCFPVEGKFGIVSIACKGIQVAVSVAGKCCDELTLRMALPVR